MKPAKPVKKIIDDMKEREVYEPACKIAKRYNLTVEEIVEPGRRRGHDASHARFLLFAVLYARGHWSTSRIGELFGVGHDVVLYGIRKAKPEDVQAIEPQVAA